MISLGITAYNEEQNIGKLLSAVFSSSCIPSQVIVVASGCTDNTVHIAQGYPCQVIVQEKREGKASAVNAFIRAAHGDILILESADTIPSHNAFRYLTEPFKDSKVGMTGAHPIPVNDVRTNLGYVGALLWRGHHKLSLAKPKSGEVVAFRNIVKMIDPKTAVDEACIEYEISKVGLMKCYCPDALIFNKTPTTLQDLIKQRKRIYKGHLSLRNNGYSVSTLPMWDLIKATSKAIEFDRMWLNLYAMGIEVYSRYIAGREYSKTKEEPTIWDISLTTKDLNA